MKKWIKTEKAYISKDDITAFTFDSNVLKIFLNGGQVEIHGDEAVKYWQELSTGAESKSESGFGQFPFHL